MNSFLVPGLALIAGVLAEALILRYLLDMLENTGAVRPNYLGLNIPVSVGISFPAAVMFVYMLAALLSRYRPSYDLFMLGLMTISFLGFIDDMLGQRDTLGFKGHIGALLRGRLTTGGLKAGGGFALALFLAFFHSPTITDLVINCLVIGLFTNLINLLDLRPGRAAKGFLFFLLVIIGLAAGKVEWMLVAPLLGAVLYYFRFDVGARTMMGDAGSNVLGLSLGYFTVLFLPFWCRAGFLLFLIGMHIYTEKYSLSNTIEKISWLRAIDQWGRPKSAAHSND
ncbi:MAG: hypothetical protein ACM3PE_06020 [Deltaproteobacteria bacterium]